MILWLLWSGRLNALYCYGGTDVLLGVAVLAVIVGTALRPRQS